MIILDTDHLSVLQFPSSERAKNLTRRLDSATELIATTIISVEEQMRGWMVAIAKERQPRRQISAYRNLAELFAFFAQFEILLFDDDAVDEFEKLPTSTRRLGAMDRKIAAIVLSKDAMLLTANSSDFRQVPSLHFESWLDP